jgi:hypothetical protein
LNSDDLNGNRLRISPPDLTQQASPPFADECRELATVFAPQHTDLVWHVSNRHYTKDEKRRVHQAVRQTWERLYAWQDLRT